MTTVCVNHWISDYIKFCNCTLAATSNSLFRGPVFNTSSGWILFCSFIHEIGFWVLFERLLVHTDGQTYIIRNGNHVTVNNRTSPLWVIIQLFDVWKIKLWFKTYWKVVRTQFSTTLLLFYKCCHGIKLFLVFVCNSIFTFTHVFPSWDISQKCVAEQHSQWKPALLVEENGSQNLMRKGVGRFFM